MTDQQEESSSEEEEKSIDLPQPTTLGTPTYRYLLWEEIDQEYFPSELPTNALTWVMLSKGKQKVPKLYERARILSCEENNRILVQYPKGSTYKVRRTHLMPVLEDQTSLIIVASETTDYRRMAIVHTLPDDHFMEIGCDFGILVDHVQSTNCKVGIDKSQESIQGAKERYPDQTYVLADVFDEEHFNTEHYNPTVVAIDINGNRLLPAVLKCIELTVNAWAPRLLIVKSRELYAKLKLRKQQELKSEY
jgi:hypothetical protein